MSSLDRRGKGRNSVILVGAPSFVSLQLAMRPLGTQTAKHGLQQSLDASVCRAVRDNPLLLKELGNHNKM